MPADAPRRVVGIEEACRTVGLSRTSIWRLQKRGEFPPAGGIGHHRKWYADVLEAWAAEQMAKRFTPPAARVPTSAQPPADSPPTT